MAKKGMLLTVAAIGATALSASGGTAHERHERQTRRVASESQPAPKPCKPRPSNGKAPPHDVCELRPKAPSAAS